MIGFSKHYPPARIIKIVVSIVIGIVVTSTAYQAVDWYNRDQALNHQADMILRRALDLGAEIRIATDAIAAGTAAPCSPADLAALHRIALDSFYLMNVGRMRDGRILCDVINDTEPPIRDLGPPTFVTKDRGGLKIWAEAVVDRDSRVGPIVAATETGVVFARPIIFRDLFSALGTARALIRSTNARRTLIGSGTADGSTAGAAGSGGSILDHVVERCDDDGNVCVDIRDSARLAGFGDASLGELALVAAGTLVGLAFYVLGRAWLARRRALVNRLKRAIRHDDLHLDYQPLMRIADRRMVGVEALARWRLPSGEFVPPDVFIPLAERAGLLTDLTSNVIARALSELAPMLVADRGLYVSINVSTHDLLGTSLAEQLDAECARNDIPHDRVAIEITERATDDMSRIHTAIAALRGTGYRVFLDDFGTGYSSLAYLATLPIDTIKLDKLFTRSVGTSLVGTAVLRQICAMIATLDLKIVFEGVETERDAAVLEELAPGAIGQGWLFGRPVAADEILRLAT